MRFIGFLVLIALIVGTIGYFRGWISFSQETNAGETQVGLTVNKEGFSEDLDKAKSKVQGLLEKIGKGTVSGNVQSVNRNELVLETSDGEVTLPLGDLGNQLSGITAGSDVTVHVDDGKVTKVEPK